MILISHPDYGYNEFLAEKLMNLFPPREAFAFFEANEVRCVYRGPCHLGY